MTTTNTTTTQTGTVEHIDPNTVIIEANVRPSAPITKEFVNSIRENGVLTPVLARRDEQGNILVRTGQRRTLGAREAGVATIPVYVVDADEKTTERIVQQMVENDQREALTDADRTAAWQQLTFEGMSVATIAKRTGTKSGEVKSGLAVAGSTVAASAITEYQLTLDQALGLTEFEDNDQARADLISTAQSNPEQFTHVLQRLRDARLVAQLKAEKIAELTAQGYTVPDSDPSYDYYDKTYTAIRELLTADDEPVTAEHIAEIEGRAAFVNVYGTTDVKVSYYLTDPKAAGFHRYGQTAKEPMTEEQKAERKTLIANNKAWDSAETVRREWLGEFLTRKTLPKDAPQFIARGLTLHHSTVGTGLQQTNSLAHKLMGVEQSSYYSPDALGAIVEKTPTKALHVALAVVLGGIEESTNRWSWRSPSAHTAAYLNQIEAWGYTLSDVERIAAGKKDTPTETE